MSIIISMISKKGGVVCSDGRRFSSITIDSNGFAINPPIIESDKHDKTFTVYDKYLGASCGLLSFSNLSIAEHVSQILDDNGGDNIDEIDLINTEIKNRLMLIPSNQIRFDSRKVDLLLVGRNRKRKMQISAIRFFPENQSIESIITTVKNTDPNSYYIFGDDNAQKGAMSVFKQNKTANSDIEFLVKLSKDAINRGIKSSGNYQYCSEKACGGQVYFKSISRT